MSAPLKVLIAEDNPSDADLLLRALRLAGFEPNWKCVDREEDFLGALSAGIDLVISDYEMPQFSGLRALQLVKEHCPDVPLIIVSGTIGEETAVEAMRLGAADYLMKDRLARLGQSVEHALAGKLMQEDRHQAEAARERLMAILESTTDLVSIADPVGHLLYLNHAGRTLLGVGLEDDITKTTIADFLPNPASHPILTEGIPAAVRAGTWTGETVLLSRSGKEFPVSQVILAHKAVNGELEFLSTVMRDISAQKQGIAALRASEQRFKALFAQAAVGVALADAATGRFVQVNQRYADILGRSPAELEQLTFAEITHPEDLAYDQDMARQIQAGPRREFSREKRYRRKDGSDVWVNLTISAMWAPGDPPDYFIAVVQDITERKQLEEQFRQSQKMEAFGQLAGGVAHDFNNILAVMMMQAQLSEMASGLPPEVRKGLHVIRAAAERGSNLTRQLLLFSHKQVMQPRDLDLNEVVTSLTKLLQRIIEENVHLQLQLNTTPLITHADAGMVDQVLMNLVINARDAMPGGGQLVIETAEKIVDEDYARRHLGAIQGRYVCLSVSDSGSGIPPHVLPRIFEPFFTTKGPGKGTGLGLATLFGIVKQHRGWVEVESELGRGTAFHVFLPASEADVAEVTRAPESKPRGGTETILLVEDDPAVRLLTRAVLERAGYRVLEAHDGVEALRIWEQQQSTIALLFTDIVMPGEVSGHELVAQLQVDNPMLRIVFTSGYNADVTGRKFVLEEGRNFIQKPASQRRMLETVRWCLDG